MFKRFLLVNTFLLVYTAAFAQEMYLSISGQNVSVQSGDSRNQYDIWIKPVDGNTNGNLQIYDAGLGGAVDLIPNNIAYTSTTFQLFSFDDLYTERGHSVVPKADANEFITQLVAKDEERFKNRWVPLSDISGSSGNGYIVRVSTDEGDDVNSFNFRVVNAEGNVLTGSSWKIITIDLSIGIFQSNLNYYFQLKPYKSIPSADLLVNGEEDSEVNKIDSFGDLYPISGITISPSRYGINNDWGLHIKGSQQKLNTFTVYGIAQPILWEFEPVVLKKLTEPQLSISEIDASQCTEKTFELSGSGFSAYELSKAKWVLSNKEIGTGSSPTITFTNRGNIPLDILLPNERSYFPQYWPYSKIVFVNTPPVATLDVPKDILSPAESIVLSAEKSYDPEGKSIGYSWFVNGSKRSSNPTFVFSNTVSGTYKVTLQVSDGGNSPTCSISEKTVSLRVNTQPYAEIDVVPVSGTNDLITISVINNTDADNDNLTYKWEGLGIPRNSTGKTITIQQQRPGIYPIRLAINDGSNALNSSYVVNRVYEVNAAPIPQFSIPLQVAPGQILPLDASLTTDSNNDVLTYFWYVNDNEVSRTKLTTISLNEPGDYQIKLAVDDRRGVSNSKQSLIRLLHVNTPPTALITAASVTASGRVTFSGEKSVDSETKLVSYDWDFGDGNTGTGAKVEHIYEKTGTYFATLTVDDGSGLANSIQSTRHKIVVNTFPVAQFQVPLVVAPGQAFRIDGSNSADADGSITGYEWYINGLSADKNPSTLVTLNEPGLHTVSLKVKDDSGFDEAANLASQTIRVNVSPVALWKTIPEHLVPNTEIKFTAEDSYDPDGTIDRYTWEFEEGVVIRGKQIQRIFKDGGPQKFTLSVTDNDGLENSTTTIEGIVKVNNTPYIITETYIRSNSVNVKLDASESYDLDNDPINFEWTLPDGSKRREASFTWTAPEPGVHILGLVVDDGLGLSNSVEKESVQVLINRPVKAVVDSVISSCTGQSVLFNSSNSFDPDGDPFKVSWNFGNGKFSDEANPTMVFEKTGFYETILTLEDGFTEEKTVAKIPVIIEGSPFAKLNINDTTICVNTPITFDGNASTDPSGNLSSYNWEMGDGTTLNGATINHMFSEPGIYTVTLTVEGSGSGRCSKVSQASAKVKVVAGPVATFEIPEWLAPGELLNLDGSLSKTVGGLKSAEWLIDSENSSDKVPGLINSYSFTTPGEYFITLNIVTNTKAACNMVSLTKSIKVNSKPVISWDLPENIPAGSDLKLDALASYDPDGYLTQYKWYIDDGFIGYNATEIIKTIANGRHKVSLEIYDNSTASNNSTVVEKYFFANSGPRPVIDAPKFVYQNQEVKVRSGVSQDLDGDMLLTTWKLDGKTLLSPAFKATEAKSYRITLIQNDGRGLSNSIDSAVVEIAPGKIPDISPHYPPVISLGGLLTINDLKISEDWFFANRNATEKSWRATTAGLNDIVLVWSPQGTELSRKTFPITIADPLRFTAQEPPITMDWNPANPTIILTAPPVNRKPGEVVYTWKQNGTVIGKGPQQNAKLIKGQNKFTVEVEDKIVAQSKPVSTQIIVTTQ